MKSPTYPSQHFPTRFHPSLSIGFFFSPSLSLSFILILLQIIKISWGFEKKKTRQKYDFIAYLCNEKSWNEEDWFGKLVKWKMGSGHLNRFQEDCWLGEEHLVSLLQRILLNSNEHACCVNEMGSALHDLRNGTKDEDFLH